MKNTFQATSFTKQQFCNVEYLDKKYVLIRPTLTSYDIMILKAYCYVTGYKAELTDPSHRALIVDVKQDIGYLVQKDKKGLFLYSNKHKQKLYINFDNILTEIAGNSGLDKTLDILSDYLSDGIIRAEVKGSEVLFVHEKTI